MGVPLQVFTAAYAALETVRGTDLTVTRKIYGESFGLDHTVATIRPEELRGSYEGFFQVAAGPERSVVNVSGRVSYDDIIWWANLGWKAVASGTGAGTDKTWTFVPTNTSDDVKTTTMQLGDINAIATSPGVKLNYGMLDSFNIHYEKNDDGAATFSGSILFAKALTQITAFTGGPPADRVTVPVSCNNTVIKIDTTTIGTTSDPLVTSVDFTLNLNPVPFYALDGTLAAQAVYRPAHRTWKAEITRQYNAATEFSAYVAKTIRKVRVVTTSSTIIAGSAVPYSLTQDMYGVWTDRKYADVDGIVTEVLTLEPVFDTGTSSSTSLIAVNATAAIT
jgi:hypothetical protein